jgi:uncharacterized protein (TIGR03545 family)
MRWKALYIIVTLSVLFGVLGYFFLDNILGWSMQRSMETITGAKVEITDFRLSFRQLSVSIGKLEIANPANTWRNLVEARNLRCQLALEPLYSGRVLIEEIDIEDLMLNTPRSTDGKLDRPLLPGPFGEAQTELHQNIAALPVLNPDQLGDQIDVSKLFASYKFKTDFASVDVYQRIEDSNQKWQQNIKDLDKSKLEIQALGQKIRQLQAPHNADPVEIKHQLDELKAIQNATHVLEQQVGTSRNNLSRDFTVLTDDISNLRHSAEDDYHDLLKLAKLPDFTTLNISEALFGQFLLNESAVFVKLIEKVQTNIPVEINSPPKENHPLGGQDIVFPGRATYPRLLIKHIGISAQGTPDSGWEGYYAQGSIDGITSEPPVYGLPINVALHGRATNQAYLEFNGRINHTNPAFADQMHVKLGNLPLPEVKLSNSPYLPSKIIAGSGEVITDIQIQPNYFLLNLTFTGHNLLGSFADKPAPSDAVSAIVRQALTKMDQLTVKYQLEGVGNQLKMKMSSDLDDLILSRIKAAVGEKIAKYTAEIRAKVDARLQDKQRELESRRRQYQESLTGKVNEAQGLIDKQKQEIAAKQQELEAKLKQEAEQKKNEADAKLKQEAEQKKKELENKLKNLF